MFPISILSLLFFFQSKICESTRNKSDGEASGHKMKKDFFLFLYYYQYRINTWVPYQPLVPW